MDTVFRLLYYSEQYPKSTAMNHAMMTLCHRLDEVPELPIDEIAELCSTNPMMLSRIARKIGYNNFPEFRMAARDTASGRRYLNRSIPMDLVDRGDPAASFLCYMEELIDRLRSPETAAEIDRVCVALRRAERVHFYGPPHFSIYMYMLLHDMISDGKEISLCTSEEDVAADLDAVGERSLVFLVPTGAALARRIMEETEAKGACLVLHTEQGDPLLRFAVGPALAYPGDQTAAGALAGSFLLNMLMMTYRSRYLDRT